MTPGELFLLLDEHNDRVIRDREERVTYAYLTARWSRSGTEMPRLEDVLQELRKRAQQTPDTGQQADERMFAMVQRMHAKLNRGEGTDHGGRA